MGKTKYGNIDGLRTIAAIGIILMHILINTSYKLDNLVIDVLKQAGHFVQLFFIISGFGMCCGYYEKIKNGQISLDKFFKNRYLKLLPFFLLMVIIDIVVGGFELNSLKEAMANITLLYGFLPNSNIEVIGVGWAMGVIFAFYCLFPFVVFMLWNKKRAWLFFAITLIINWLCMEYFLVDGEPVRCSIMRWLCFFVAGGIIYLYNKNIICFVKKYKVVCLIATLTISVIWYITPTELSGYDLMPIKDLIIFSVWLCYAISVKSKFLCNGITKFISSISFEIYLAHMMFFRIFEKLGMLQMFESDMLSFVVLSIIMIVSVIVFSVVVKKFIDKGLNALIKVK